MKKESLSTSMSKLILTIVLIICIGTTFGLMGYYSTKTPTKTKIPENKIAWAMYNSVDKSLFDWENYNIKYPSDWNYTEERISSSRKTGTLMTIFTDSKRFNKLLIITGGKRLDNMTNQNMSEIKFSNNVFYKYNNIETEQVYYIYKTGLDEEINFGMETEIFFKFNNTDENIIKEILGSFSLNLSVELISTEIEIINDTSDWQTYRNEEFEFEFEYPSKFGEVIFEINPEIALVKEGEKRGMKMEGYFSNKSGIIFGGKTANYDDVSREITKIDFKGYTKNNEGYFFGFNPYQNELYGKMTPKKIINDNILLVNCKSFAERCFIIDTYMSRTVDEDLKHSMAGLINLKKGEFSGLMMLANDKYIREDEFIKILSTFKFIEN